MNQKNRIGIVGGAGYTGGELLRILLNHPQVDITFVQSRSQAGKPIYAAHPNLIGETELIFTDDLEPHPSGGSMEGADVIFLCLGHGESAKFLAENQAFIPSRIIDLSQDFRDESQDFVYGLPELNSEKIRQASKIANPGCFATAIQLALLPLAKAGFLQNDVHISAVTGSTGAGQKLTDTVHFSWRSGNISVYKAFTHQHLKEIRQSLVQLQPGFLQKINFVPYRGNFTRGILASIYTDFEGSLEEATDLYQTFYQNTPFTHLTDSELDIKQVINTNKCLLHLEKHDDQLFITSVIDNLTKGASGQAVQNMNLMLGLDEKTGLNLKAVAF
jgi:N-acetyl-gamma-glutamyl-phosphate reductase